MAPQRRWRRVETKPNVKQQVTAVERAFKTHHTAWISGPAGSGRSTLAERVKKRLPRSSVVELLPITELDAAPTFLLMAATGLEEGLADLLADIGSPKERGGRLGDALREAGRVVVIRVPASWSHAMRARADDSGPHDDATGGERPYLEYLTVTATLVTPFGEPKRRGRTGVGQPRDVDTTHDGP